MNKHYSTIKELLNDIDKEMTKEIEDTSKNLFKIRFKEYIQNIKNIRGYKPIGFKR